METDQNEIDSDFIRACQRAEANHPFNQDDYVRAGWVLFKILPDYFHDKPGKVDKWDKLETKIKNDNLFGIVSWVKNEVPGYMDLVPDNRQEYVAKGIMEAWHEKMNGDK